MSDHRPYVAYLRDCFRADNRETGLFDFMDDKTEHSLFIEGQEQLLTDMLPKIPVHPDWAVRTQTSAQLWTRERKLIYGSFFILATIKKPGKRSPNICAPLFLYPATIQQDVVGGEPLYFLQINQAGVQLNVPVLTTLLGQLGQGDQLESLLSEIPKAPFDIVKIHTLGQLLESALPGIDVKTLDDHPELISEKSLKGRQKSVRGTDKMRCLPVSAVGLIKNSPQTQGLLYELDAMSKVETTSASVRMAFGDDVVTKELDSNANVGVIPAILSDAQRNALISSATYPLTLVVGPPGTGKSYTMATIALEHIYRGDSVVIAARTEQALDVLAEKVETMMGDLGVFVMRAGKGGHTRAMRRFLKQLLHGGIDLKVPSKQAIARIEANLDQTDASIAKLEQALIRRAEQHITWGRNVCDAELGGTAGFWSGVKKQWGHWRLSSGYTAEGDALDRYMRQYERLLQRRTELIRELLRYRVRTRMALALKNNRKQLRELSNGLSVHVSSIKDEVFSKLNFSDLLHTLPLWMVTLPELNNVLPLQPEIFDLALIDEATQCDMASSVPVMHRAKRVTITGDPQQLRHVSFLSRERQQLLAEKNGLNVQQQTRFDFRAKSVLDLIDESVREQAQVVFLDEHYRSVPKIIGFSNRQFYDNALKVMTQQPQLQKTPAVDVVYVQGERGKNGVNEVEAAALVSGVEEWITRERNLEHGAHSIGILSPFRDQVDRLSDLLIQHFDYSEIEKHNIVVGTAYAFQGEERDVMFLSFGVGPGSPLATFRYLDRADVFNVSVTRARNKQIIYTSVTPDDVPADSLLRHYLQEGAKGGVADVAQETVPTDPFLEQVKAAFEDRAFHAHVAWPVAGMTIDLLVEREGRSVGIDLIGYPGHFEALYELDRYRMLARAGLTVVPLPWGAWRQNSEACVQTVLTRWQISG